MSEYRLANGFPTTYWSRVLRAGDPTDSEGRDALGQLCRDYRGLDQEKAADLVQGFLAVPAGAIGKSCAKKSREPLPTQPRSMLRLPIG